MQRFHTFKFRAASVGIGMIAGAGRRWPRKQPVPTAYILPPTAPGSLGDEAMITVAAEQLAANGFGAIRIIQYTPTDKWDIPTVPVEYFDLSTFLGKASFASSRVLYRLARNCSNFFALGADVMDGYYNPTNSFKRVMLVSMAAQSGADTTVCGFSMNAHPDPMVLQALQDLPPEVRLCARDPVSQGRLERAISHDIAEAADLAFLLRPETESPRIAPYLNWCESLRRNGQRIIGVNFNAIFFDDRRLGILAESDLIRAYVRELTDLLRAVPDLHILLLPHDHRGTKNDLYFATAAWRALPSDVAERCNCVSEALRATEMKAICGGVDVVMSGRMHLGIAALGSGVPTAIMSSQGKVEGLGQLFALPELALEPAAVLRQGALAHSALGLLQRRDEMAQHIRARLPKVRRLSMRNFPIQATPPATVTDVDAGGAATLLSTPRA